MSKGRSGYITIVSLIGVLALGSVFYGTVLNARWVQSSRESHQKTESVLAADYHGRAGTENGRYFYKVDGHMIWWSFVAKNICPLREMLRFKHSIREFHKYTQDYVSKNYIAHTAGVNRDMKPGSVYKKFMNEFINKHTDTLWVLPSLKDIPDSEKVLQESYKEDAVAAFIIESDMTKKYYAKEDLSRPREISEFYSDSLNNIHKFKKIKLEMPFSQY